MEGSGAGTGLLSGRSGVSAERRHFEFGQRRSADAPLRSKKLSARGDQPSPDYGATGARPTKINRCLSVPRRRFIRKQH